jgi:hypothetical protein
LQGMKILMPTSNHLVERVATKSCIGFHGVSPSVIKCDHQEKGSD